MLNKILAALLLGIRPLLGPARCHFELTCGNYALVQLQEKPLFSALWAITKRLFSCSPLYKFMR